MTMQSVLTREQMEEVRTRYRLTSAGKLAKEYGCSRGVIAGIWKRNRDRIGLPIKPTITEINKDRDDEIFRRYCDLTQGATLIAAEMGLGTRLVENVLKRKRKKAGMKPHRKHSGAVPKKDRPRRKEIRVTGEDGKPLPYAPPHAPAYGPPVTFEQLDDLLLSDSAVIMCRHYVGNANDSLFCGRPSKPGRPYCFEHAMLAYRSDRAPPRTQATADKIKKQAREFLEWRRRQAETQERVRAAVNRVIRRAA